jgi:HlyD family secretion protein
MNGMPLTRTRIGAALYGSALLGLILAGCGGKERGEFLGSAVVEVETRQVPALAQGPLVLVLKDEGDAVRQGELLALVDTLPYSLQVHEAAAGLAELASTLNSQASQISSLSSDARGLEQEAGRVQALVKTGSATAQQWDQIAAARDAAQFRLRAARQGLEGLEGRRAALQSRLDFLANQLDRCRIVSPADGSVLTRYRNAGESVGPGQSVFEVGRRDSVRADFFVPQEVLASLALGDTVRIRVERAGGADQAAHVPAVIRFISSEAEFTPKNIQTRESRAELIFRVRAQAASGDGLLKRGLPVEVWR